MVPSSSGLGHHPLKVETRVQIPLGLHTLGLPLGLLNHAPAEDLEPSEAPTVAQGCLVWLAQARSVGLVLIRAE